MDLFFQLKPYYLPTFLLDIVNMWWTFSMETLLAACLLLNIDKKLVESQGRVFHL